MAAKPRTPLMYVLLSFRLFDLLLSAARAGEVGLFATELGERVFDGI